MNAKSRNCPPSIKEKENKIMAMQVVDTAILVCSAGSSPSNLKVIPTSVKGEKKNQANILDHVSGTNIFPFGTCAITLAACSPSTPSPWSSGSPNVCTRKSPTLRNIDTLACTIGGTISVSSPAEGTIKVN